MPLFGDEMAENDGKRLYDVYIPENHDEYLEDDGIILTGHWGIGKTASTFYQNKELEKLLNSMDLSYSRLWYIDKDKIDIVSLSRLQKKYEDKYLLLRIFEDLWKVKIVGTMCKMLVVLQKNYDKKNSKHWKSIAKIVPYFNRYKGFWKFSDQLITSFLGRDSAVSEMQNWFDKFLSDNIFYNLQKCLKDTKNNKIQPILIIEPIDSPNIYAKIDIGMSRLLIVSLLNVIDSTFAPNPNQLIKTKIIVPWHLLPCYNWESINFNDFYGVQLDNPQHLYQYIYSLKWEKKRLLKVIEKRIEWEFDLRKIHYKKNDNMWNKLFEEKIVHKINSNGHKKQILKENSFDYILRHTHHRVRDIISLTRKCVKIYSDLNDLTVTKIFKEAGTGKKVNQKAMEAVITNSSIPVSSLLFNEGKRRYPELSDIINKIRGLSIPIEKDVLQRQRFQDDKIDIALDILWDCGFIGIEITPIGIEGVTELKKRIGDEKSVKYEINSEKIIKYNIFEYNYDGNPLIALENYNNSKYSNAKIIFHPITFTFLNSTSNVDYPIGI